MMKWLVTNDNPHKGFVVEADWVASDNAGTLIFYDDKLHALMMIASGKWSMCIAEGQTTEIWPS